MLTCPHCPLDVTPTLPPISSLITPYASTPPPLLRRPQDIPPLPPSTLLTPSPIHLILTLLQFPPDMPPMLLPHQPNPQCHLSSLCSCNALKMRLQFSAYLRPHHSLCFCTPASSSLLLTILTLPRHLQDMPLMPLLAPLTPKPLSTGYHPSAWVLDP
ncbi:hypothetical protein O181_065209 [Austropuccinia psidii MF-1]|uniref:Uncharacterized protein n=1 Tax=Austropuccinia psidii MF-1 TaxID=1389203 RepID=A0A9Q3EQM4_9BASI|nr:hypothetical protein [Austropuccinia psidii MF-1]